MLARSRTPRPAALTVESAVVYPLLFVLLFALIVGGLGVFRFQQVALQAREASRWASTHGSTYQKESGQTSPTADQIRQQVVLPLAAGMETAKVTVQVQWVDGQTGAVSDWDTASKATTGWTAAGDPVTNRVRVTITYQWSPELLLAGPLNLRSVSEVPMAY